MRTTHSSPARGAARTFRIFIALCACLACLLHLAPRARAHVIVTPTSSAPGATEEYTVTVPTERGVPTTKVRLQIPDGVTVYQYNDPPGWQRELDTAGNGRVTAITWSGGTILPTQYAQFGFMAGNPSGGRQLIWKASQTYQDGLVVAWNGASSSQQPASFTSLSLQGAAGSSGTSDGGSGSGDHTLGEVGLSVALLALALSLFANGLLILTLRRRIVGHEDED